MMAKSRVMVAALAAGIIFSSSAVAAGPLSSPKRGLVFTPNSTHPEDAAIWRQPVSDLTWYYNYGHRPSSALSSWSQAEFEFVPMLWGAPPDANDTTFLQTVRGLIRDDGINITHVLGFNEPDGPTQYGGSGVDPAHGAQVWLSNVAPLRQLGVKLGLPACMGAETALPWLAQFLGNCSALLGHNQSCPYDFVPLHWYGDFKGLASHMGQYAAAFPNATLWITEYNLPDANLADTQSFYNTSSEYMDRMGSVGRYSLFGAFRSDVSNVGPNAAMLGSKGQLTDMGAWYLGRPATGVENKAPSPAGRVVPSMVVSWLAFFGTVFLVVGA